MTSLLFVTAEAIVYIGSVQIGRIENLKSVDINMFNFDDLTDTPTYGKLNMSTCLAGAGVT